MTIASTALAACSTSDPLSPANNTMPSTVAEATIAASALAANVRIKCELRTSRRSRISVVDNDLTPLNARWSAVVRSEMNAAAAPLKTAVGDEVEFDFDSNPNDIGAGATRIAGNFIVANPARPDVTAQILNAAGAVVASGSDCAVR